MGTRGAIARKNDTGFKGTYHHWDSNPTGLGNTLYNLYHKHFNKDIESMLKVLIDDHPAGWSTINDKDFSKEAGFLEYPSKEDRDDRPLCYCHGDRKESVWEITDKNAAGSGVEYAYVFEKNIMHILSSYVGETKMVGFFGSGNPNSTWVSIATIDLDHKEPDWESIE